MLREDCLVHLLILLSVGLVCSEKESTPTQPCPDVSIPDLQQRIQVEPCGKKICKLLRGSNATVTFKFKPEDKVQSLVNEVYADIEGLKLPFVGVTGTNACKNVSRADTGDKVPCPLAANEEYIYQIAFPIEDFYPPISMRVHWSLISGDKKVLCFVMPAVIK